MRVLHLINDVTPTSISLEIAERIETCTPADIYVASFYDGPEDVRRSSVSTGFDIKYLNSGTRYDVRSYLELRKFAEDTSVDILHTHHNSVGSLARLFFTGTGIDIVNTEHRSHDSFSRLQLLANIVSYPNIDAMVSNSEHTRDSIKSFERMLLVGTASHVVYNGVDMEKIAEHATDNGSVDLPSGPIVTNVARMIDVKNQGYLIQAFEDVLESHPEAALVMVGDGPLKGDLVEMAESLGISDSVRFVGEVPRETVYGILNQSDIFVMPSVSEGFCVAAVEAMAAGLPIVASNIDVFREIIGDDGLFFDPHDSRALSNEIVELLERKELRTRTAKRLNERAESVFPIDKTAKEYYDIYRELS